MQKPTQINPNSDLTSAAAWNNPITRRRFLKKSGGATLTLGLVGYTSLPSVWAQGSGYDLFPWRTTEVLTGGGWVFEDVVAGNDTLASFYGMDRAAQEEPHTPGDTVESTSEGKHYSSQPNLSGYPQRINSWDSVDTDVELKPNGKYRVTVTVTGEMTVVTKYGP